MVNRYLKNKKILITAGPTWVAIDNVRVISNIASGKTGILLAKQVRKFGAKVTLMLGPVVNGCCLDSSVRIVRFKFFDELKSRLIKELRSGKYDAVIHGAAVADYRPEKACAGKIESGIKKLRINLIPTPKILDLIKKVNSSLLVVAFKFQPQAGRNTLIKKAKVLIARSSADLVVANTVYAGHYRAYIVRENSVSKPLFSKQALSEALIKEIGVRICRKLN